MTFGLKTSTVELLKRFNMSFPQFYEQFVSSEIQLQNLRLAYQLYQTKEAVIELKSESSKSVLYFAYRNQSFLLNDIFYTKYNFNFMKIELIKYIIVYNFI